MTENIYRQADKTLSGKLQFGDFDQINAVKTLARLEEIRDAINECDCDEMPYTTCEDCGGSGDCDCPNCGDGHVCAFCDGSGEAFEPCIHLEPYDEDEIREAVSRFKTRHQAIIKALRVYVPARIQDSNQLSLELQ